MNLVWTGLTLYLALFLQQSAISVAFDATWDRPLFRITGWTDAAKEADRWAEILNVFVDNGSNAGDVPSLSGTRELRGADLVFIPRYPPGRGLRLKVELRIPGRDPVIRFFETPKADLTPTTVVEHVYPSASVLPENQLKFYIHFSAPMSRGEAYKRIYLLNESGRPVQLPFLELDQELWDAAGQRLTLFFDPGRIKREVLPNKELGPPIEAGHPYSLVIDGGWPDADGKPLKSDTQKRFTVGPADRKPLDTKSWKVLQPAAGTTAPLYVDFPEPLDHALMLRQLEVIDASGIVIEGSVESERDEMRWSFKPERPWKPGNYALRIGTVIADLAGNMIDRPFEIDLFDTVSEHLTRETRLVTFTIQ